MMRIATFRTIAEIDTTVWNEIVPTNRLICRHEYLQAVETSRINDCRYFYPVVYEGDRIIAHTCLYFISTELDSFAQGILKKIIGGVRRLWKSFLILRSVECGTPVALGNTISFREGTDKSAVLAKILNETERIAADLDVGVVLFRDFYEQELDFYDKVRHSGYVRIHNLPCARMSIRWDSFDAYVRSLRSEYRNKLLARLRKFRNGPTSIELVKDFSSCSADLARLWKNVYDRAREYRREIILQDFFENMAAYLKDRAAVILARV